MIIYFVNSFSYLIHYYCRNLIILLSFKLLSDYYILSFYCRSLDDILSSLSAFTDIHVSTKDFFETIIRQLFDTKEWDKLQTTIEEMAKQVID